MDVVYGIHPVKMAFRSSRRQLQRLFVKKTEKISHNASLNELFKEATLKNVPIKQVSSKALDFMTGHAVHQGICLQASPLQYIKWTDCSFKEKHDEANVLKLWVVMNGIHDPMNYGAILRNCYFMGVDCILSTLDNSCGLTPVVSKASAGVMELVDMYGLKCLNSFLKQASNFNWKIVGTVGHRHLKNTSVNVREFKFDRNVLLLLGNEGTGLSDEILNSCDELLKLMPGPNVLPEVDSLNVSVAAGIILHSICSQKPSQLIK